MLKKVVVFIYVALVLTMGLATLLEYGLGSSFVYQHIYHSTAFCLTWGVLTILTITLCIRLKMWKRIFLFLMHISFAVILLGAFLTFLTGKKGSMHLRTGTSSFQYVEKDTRLVKDLPFILHLDTFEIKYTPDTRNVWDYISKIRCLSEDDSSERCAEISMNQIFKYKGYRFYQSSYDEDKNGTWLTVNYDPFGTLFTYIGYWLWGLSMLGIFFSHSEKFRCLLQRLSIKRAFLFLSMLGTMLAILSLQDYWTDPLYDLDVHEESFLQTKAEILYTSIPFGKIVFAINIVLGLLGFVWTLYANKRYFPCAMRKMIEIGLYFSFFIHALGYALRWYISGRIPLGSGYETLLFMAFFIMLLAIVLRKNFSFAVSWGLLLSGIVLGVSLMESMDSSITPLPSVLASPWLSIHVSCIMVAYTFFAFIGLNGFIGLCFPQKSNELMMFSQLMLYPGIFLLGVGIFIGAVWANVSWGRYWAWDPKEVWALITFMVYGVPFHLESLPWLNDSKSFHRYLFLAFITVIITFGGVNYILGGMHSYA